MSSIESALVILVPEAEGLVKSFRDRHDPSAAVGVPAHITLLHPFKPPPEIGPSVFDALRQCFARFTPFQFSLNASRRFPGVLYLAPEPDEPFRRLTLAIWDSFPEIPPYGGNHPDIVPHLCVAQVADEKLLDRIAEEFTQASQKGLPTHAVAAEVALMDTKSGRWQVSFVFGLGST
jgi:2'-5' RNA ligase